MCIEINHIKLSPQNLTLVPGIYKISIEITKPPTISRDYQRDFKSSTCRITKVAPYTFTDDDNSLNTPVSTIMNNVITTTTRDTAITEQAIEKPIEDRSGHLDSKVDKEDLLGE